MQKVVVIGEVLAEIMATQPGNGFTTPTPLLGPYPSGAPAIFIDQVAKLNHPCAIISAVGDDDFGKVNIDRLTSDGVDTSGILIDTDRPTGTAFVRYRTDGSRDFVFNIKHSACGSILRCDQILNVLETADHFHVMGSSLSSPELVQLNLETVAAVKSRGGSVSFDPNLRAELLDAPGMREAMIQILGQTDLFLPSDGELGLLTGTHNIADAIARVLALGVQAIVHKQGAKGATYHDQNGSRTAMGFVVDDIDPTGAGDCFGGAFTALWLRGADIDHALTLACAAGALSVTQLGPMEGTATLAQLESFISTTDRQLP